MLTPTMTAACAFIFQTFVVFAGNSRLFGLIPPGHGWYTNVEMAERYASLVTPAKFAFAIWGIIYTWETVALFYLAFGPAESGWSLRLWLAANGFQALWAPLFATERLGASGVALAGIAVSLVALGISLRASSGAAYGLLVAPIWVHAGWTTAAAIVNLNLFTAYRLHLDAATQLALAFGSAAAAAVIGLAVAFFATDPAVGATSWAPLPLVVALCWALNAIRAELARPDLIKHATAYAQIGPIGQAALQRVDAGAAFTLAAGAATIFVARVAARHNWGVPMF